MNKNLNDILINSNEKIEEEKLLNYLNNNLNESDVHDIEMQMTDDAFMSDAVEGLADFKNKVNINDFVSQLNKDLKKQLDKKNKKQEKRLIKNEPWVYYSIILILFLIILCFLVLRKYQQQQHPVKYSSSMIWQNKVLHKNKV